RCRGARIDHRAGRMEILAHPGDPPRRIDAEMTELALDVDCRRSEILRALFPYQAGTRGKQDRGLDGARVNPVDLLLAREQSVRIAEFEPGTRNGEHVSTYAQAPRGEIDGRNIAAVAVGDHELAHAGAMHAIADLAERSDHTFGRKR